MKNKPILFLDIDDVIALSLQYNSKKKNVYGVYNFDNGCVKILNEILDATNADIILSSDWKNHFDINTMNNIMSFNCVKTDIVHYTPDLWGIKYNDLKQLEECRANEILLCVKELNIENYVAIDDLNLSKWIDDEHFVLCGRSYEGIKQIGIKEKIINKLNK